MLSMREVGLEGFGQKVREWNSTALLQEWRVAWADHVNERLAELDIDARIDHRTLEAQGIELEPQHKIGPAARSEEHTSELQSLMRISYAVFCLTKKIIQNLILRKHSTIYHTMRTEKHKQT